MNFYLLLRLKYQLSFMLKVLHNDHVLTINSWLLSLIMIIKLSILFSLCEVLYKAWRCTVIQKLSKQNVSITDMLKAGNTHQ